MSKVSPKVIYLNKLDDQSRSVLKDAGILLENVLRITGMNHAIESENCQQAGLSFVGREAYVDRFIASLNSPGELGAEVEDFDAIKKEIDSFDRFTLYQRTLAQNATFSVKSVFSEAWLRATASYVITSENWPTIAYKFSDENRDFYLIANGALGNLLALYDEQNALLLMFKSYNGRWGKNPETWVGDFLLQLGKYAEEASAYETRTNRSYCNLLYSENIAHYYWNFMNGLQRAQDRDPMSRAIFSRRSPVNCRAVFPHSAVKGSPQSDDEIFTHVLQNDLMVGLHTDYIASEALAKRMITVSQARVEKARQEEIRNVASDNKVIIWILLRNIHRSWRGQTDGLSQFIQKMQENYDGCFFIFDGHTRLDEGESNVRTQQALQNANQKHMSAEDEILAEILHKTGIENYQSVIGCDVYEKILWAEIPTFSVQPMGSGFLWTGWLTNRPAVLHTPPQSIPQFRATAYMRENCTPRIYVKPEYYLNAEDGPYLSSSYDMEWTGIWEASTALLSNHLGISPHNTD
ncbi:hypothetical protein GFB49_14120 [Epibacterium sp. SM1979]|uniref:Uncharacterized protein n=1 Tax=Tritonibacter litoralis TaxID=2662264 RepID=A0A843YDX8_9RHOB|nr:hypothetical protein [Tritonibacter litoralis]MQQ09600.1 hypothetical protein [Tritonibacter litoralis]